MQAVILAAGRGTRLRPFTDHCSKAMAPVLGKPIALRVMQQMMACGLTEFILVTNPADETLEPYFQAVAEEYQLKITFVPQKQQLGMGHAVLTAAPYLHDDFILSACDNLVKDDVMPAMLHRFHEADANAILLLKQVPPEAIPATAVVDFASDGKEIINILEKPTVEEAPTNIASLPLYVFKREFSEYLPLIQPSIRGEYEMQDAMRMMMEEQSGFFGVETDWRLTLTTAQDLYEINQHFLYTQQPQMIAGSAIIAPTATLIPPYFIDEFAEVEAHATVGPNVYLDANCIIRANAVIQNSLLMLGKELLNDEVLESQIRY